MIFERALLALWLWPMRRGRFAGASVGVSNQRSECVSKWSQGLSLKVQVQWRERWESRSCWLSWFVFVLVTWFVCRFSFESAVLVCTLPLFLCCPLSLFTAVLRVTEQWPNKQGSHIASRNTIVLCYCFRGADLVWWLANVRHRFLFLPLPNTFSRHKSRRRRCRATQQGCL